MGQTAAVIDDEDAVLLEDGFPPISNAHKL